MVDGARTKKLPVTVTPRSRRTLAIVLVAMAMATAALALTWGVGLRNEVPAVPRFHRVTFRHGSIDAARFAPGGRKIVYSSAVDGKQMRVFVTTPDNPEGRPITEPGVGLFAVSSTGMMA